MIVRNIDNHDFEFSFNFTTYKFPKNRMFKVSDDLKDFIQERWPKSFSFIEEGEVKKGVTDIQGKKTPSLISPQENQKEIKTMGVTSPQEKATFGAVDETPKSGTTDKDGVGWYGEGLQYE